VTAIDVVTADGVARRVDADHHADLFWALRGGGGATAIVTALEFRLFPLTTVQAGVLFFPVERAGEVLHAWREWLPSAPDAVTSVGRVLHFPPLPDLPPQLSGQSFAVVELTSQLDEAATRALIAPLRALGPSLDTVTTTAVADLGRLHMDPDGPVPAHGDGLMLRRLPAAAIDEMVRLSAPGTPLLSLEIRHLGGALTPGRAAQPGAADGLDGGYLMFAVGITPTPEAAAAVRVAVDAAKHGLTPWAAEAMYQNFAETPIRARRVFGSALPRLRRIKERWDPSDVIRANHPLRGE
jgi:FAD/FMN-containing dehydrogenase